MRTTPSLRASYLETFDRMRAMLSNHSAKWWEGPDQKRGGNYLANGTELYPAGLTDAVRIARDEYRVTSPIFTTENGTTADGMPEGGQVNDNDRTRYIRAFSRAAMNAHDAGLGVEGHYVWSLIDNLNWGAAYTARYGLVHVDTDDTLKRTYKNSAHWLRSALRNRSYELDDIEEAWVPIVLASWPTAKP